jgi:hypothetical protein
MEWTPPVRPASVIRWDDRRAKKLGGFRQDVYIHELSSSLSKETFQQSCTCLQKPVQDLRRLARRKNIQYQHDCQHSRAHGCLLSLSIDRIRQGASMITHPKSPGANFLAPAQGCREASGSSEGSPTASNQNFIVKANSGFIW